MATLKPKVFLTRELQPECMNAIASQCHLEYSRVDRPLSQDEIIEAARGQDCLITMLTDSIDARVIDATVHLKIIANYAVGYNNIDLAAATQRRLLISNTPDVLTDATADIAWALIFSAARRIAEGDRFVRARRWTGWSPQLMLGADVSHATLGLVGLGRIGKAMIPRAQAFSMRVLYWNRTRLPQEEERALNIAYAPLDELLPQADFLSLHLALSEETTHLIGEAAFARMKPTAFLVNTARGPIVDEKALVAALRQKLIAGAGLDVFEREPEIQEALYGMENVTLLPHVGSATIGTRVKMAQIAIQNCLAAHQGHRPPNLVNVALDSHWPTSPGQFR